MESATKLDLVKVCYSTWILTIMFIRCKYQYTVKILKSVITIEIPGFISHCLRFSNYFKPALLNKSDIHFFFFSKHNV